MATDNDGGGVDTGNAPSVNPVKFVKMPMKSIIAVFSLMIGAFIFGFFMRKGESAADQGDFVQATRSAVDSFARVKNPVNQKSLSG